ncbi:ABC transporter substrate-binding protein [Paenibacillus sp. FSL H8-0034]|uniref:ABC transporter substrate-binding protein n=1 Tax=Paenibacillus sp. FSL H8-0034 TaxID=2954671 RepID=UPI0030F75A6E
MKKKVTGIVLTTTMLSGLLAACSSSQPQPSAGNQPQSTEPKAATQPAAAPAAAPTGGGEKTKVQFWHSMGGKNKDYVEGVVKSFNESQAKIEVVATYQGGYDETVTKLQQAVAAKTSPDIAMLERAFVKMFADADVLEDLTPHLKKSNLNIEEFNPGLMGDSIYNKKLVALPFNRSTPILHVNKTMLDEKGLAIPKTWDELKKVANALVVKENGEYKRYGYTMPYDTWYMLAMITQAKGKFFNDEGTSIGFSNGEGVKMFKFLKEQQSTGALYYPPAKDSGTIVNQMFISGKVGMMMQSTGSIGGLMDNVKFDYVTAYLPMDQVYANPTGGGNVSMMSGSKNKDAAWEFMNWLMTDPKGGLKFVLDSGYLPFTKKMVESQEIKDQWAKQPNRKVAYEQLQYSIDTNKNAAWPQVMQEFFKSIEAIMYDDKDIEATLGTLKKEAERLLKK